VSEKPADSWYEATARRDAPLPALEGDIDADVCVVGAGLSGCSTALHLAERGYKVVVLEAARSGRIVNIKKGQFMAPWDMKGVMEKAATTGNRKLMVTERGFSFGYNNLVVDMKSFPTLRSFGYPVIFDVTHSVQRPGGLGDRSGGEAHFIDTLGPAGVAAGVDGLFMEVHENPARALSDGPNAYRLGRLRALLQRLLAIHEAART